MGQYHWTPGNLALALTIIQTLTTFLQSPLSYLLQRRHLHKPNPMEKQSGGETTGVASLWLRYGNQGQTVAAGVEEVNQKTCEHLKDWRGCRGGIGGVGAWQGLLREIGEGVQGESVP